MDLAEVTTRIAGALGENSGLSKTVKIDFGSAGKVFLDGVSVPNTVSNDDKPADCTLALSWDDFLKLAQGTLDPTMAYMQGKLKVVGDMGVALKLVPVFSKLR
jgi:putative sterol carrier protein